MSNNVYNKTDLDPATTFERHVFHRDQFAHYLRWNFVMKIVFDRFKTKEKTKVCDFGCGKGNMFQVMYHNRMEPDHYVGIDIRDKTIKSNAERYPKAEWISEDLVTLENGTKLSEIKADIVTSFEVIEHVGKKNADKFLENFKSCGKEGATYYLSTPVYDPDVGAADNHTYPDVKGGEPVVQEFDYGELKDLLEKHFEIVKVTGTFASIKDYKELLEGPMKEFFENVKSNLDSNILSITFAPLIPAWKCRNALWTLKVK